MRVHRQVRLSLLILMLGIGGPPLPGRDSPPPDHPTAPGIQREQVNLILIDVVVTDRKGRAVNDLRPEEFSLWVDGHPQKINSVELHWAGEAPPAGALESVPAPEGQKEAVPAFSASSPRRFVFFFDGLNSERGLGPRPIQAVRAFLQQDLLKGDEVMVVGQGKDLKIYQEFTSDRAAALKSLDAVEADPAIRTAGENRVWQNMREIQEAQDYSCTKCSPQQRVEAAQRLAVVYADEDRLRIRRTLASLRAIVASLNAGSGRKELFFLTDGFPADPDALYGSPGDPRTRAYATTPSSATSAGGIFRQVPTGTGVTLEGSILEITREAGSAQVAIHTVNTQGIARGDSAMLKGGSGRSIGEVIESTASDTLATFALGTGGVSLRGSNDFLPALERVGRETRATYVVSYVPEGEPDGLLHSTRVEVLRKGVMVRAKEGFAWLTDAQTQERQIFSAYMSPDLYHDFPLGLETVASLQDGAKPTLEFAIAVPNSMLLFLPREGQYEARLEVGLALRLGQNEISDQFSRSVEVRLTPAEMASYEQLTLLARREVAPGDYQAVAVVRDLGTGNIGALRGRVQVPALAADRMAMSSLVLAGPQPEGKRVDIEPAAVGGRDEVIPAVHRRFPRGGQIQASCFIYHPLRKEGTGEATIQVSGWIRKGEQRVRGFPTALHVFTSEQPAESIPLKVPISLTDLEPGIYTLEVQVLDKVGGRGVSQSLDFMVQ